MTKVLSSLSGPIALLVLAGLAVLAVLLILTTSMLMTQDAKARAAERQESNIRVAWNVLAQHGSGFVVSSGSALAAIAVEVDQVRQLAAEIAASAR